MLVAAMPREIKGVDPMGRGRAKAKQTKVARDLKYRPVETDFVSLERELRATQETDLYGEIPEQYADLAAEYEAQAAFDQDDVDVDFDEDDRR